VNLETEMPETLFTEMRNFIESDPHSDQYSFISSALINFLFQNGCEDRFVLESYLNDVLYNSFNKSK